MIDPDYIIRYGYLNQTISLSQAETWMGFWLEFRIRTKSGNGRCILSIR